MCGSERKRSRIALGLALVLWAASPVRAQEVTHTIMGSIEVPRGGGPDERLQVTLASPTIGGGQTIFAESGGRFVFKGVRPASYRVLVKAPPDAPYESGQEDVSVDPAPVPMIFHVRVVLEAKRVEREVRTDKTISIEESDASVPRKARKAYERGTAAARDGRYELAISHFREALAIAPDFLFALNDLGVNLMRVGKLEEAIATLRHAVSLAPTAFRPHLNLANVLLEAGDVDGAASEVARALAVDPGSPLALFTSGRVARLQGKRDAAADAFKRAYISGGAEMAIAELELGKLYEEAGLPEAAADAYKLFLASQPNGPEADFARDRLRALGAN